MGKRRLTKQQQKRIRANRNATSDNQSSDLQPSKTGLVVARYGDQAEIEFNTSDGIEHCLCHLRANLKPQTQHRQEINYEDGIVAGDRVHWSPLTGEDNGVIASVMARDSLLLRPDIRGKLRLVASNIERICLLIAPLPEPHFNLVDRYIVAAENQHIQPVLVCNKIDLLDDQTKQQINAKFKLYHELGYETFLVSAHERTGLEELEQFLQDKTSIFVGQSGVGKSSLLKSLTPEFDDEIGALSTAKSSKIKGRHTTTTSRLYHLPKGGSVIDSPGIREFGLWHLDAKAITQGFVEISNESQFCRFRDCQHQSEPDCAVLLAVKNGSISSVRLASYRHILASLNET